MQNSDIPITSRERNKRIQENLTTLERYAQKKKTAQELYYEKRGYVNSPLRKPDRPLVHLRLGSADKKIRRFVPQNSPNFVKPRMRIQHQANGLTTNRMHRNGNVIRIEAQKRLDQLRSALSVTNNMQKKVMLRRKRIEINQEKMSQPTDLRIELKNNNVQVGKNAHRMHSIRKSLSPRMQKEIELVQTQCMVSEIIPNAPIHIAPTGVTGISIHDRFSSYP